VFPKIETWSVFLVIGFLVEVGLDEYVKRQTKLAASIKEAFDCYILDLP
jgi:hypothetical protein